MVGVSNRRCLEIVYLLLDWPGSNFWELHIQNRKPQIPSSGAQILPKINYCIVARFACEQALSYCIGRFDFQSPKAKK